MRLHQMEVVCLNSVPIFDEDNELEEGDYRTEDDEDPLSKDKPPRPTVGLEFDSFDQAYDFYNIYGKEQGFGIRVSNSWFRSKRKERYRAKLSCSNAGFKKKSEANNPRPETRTGCPAMIVIKLVDSRRWRIVEIELEHNHQVSPEIKRFYKSHRRMILASKQSQQSKPIKEVHTVRLYRTTTMDASCNGYSNHDETADRNQINRSKYLEVKEGDGQAVYNYFCRMKLTNPNFFYLIDLDDEGRLRNLFWSDSKSRASYSYFNDIISIDTSSLTNNYEIPLISFVGVNHHGQSVLLGCGFIGDESVESYVWIFKAWLTCMIGRAPQVIVSDLSKPLQNAVFAVFPQSRHCFCLWYIMERIPEKLGGLKGYEAIKKQIRTAVYDSLRIVEFETCWSDMVKSHGLSDNRWLRELYEDRERWVPVFLKDTSFAGMIPMSENAAMKMFFDGYVHKHTSFKEFVEKYDLALQRRFVQEAMADLESTNGSYDLKTRCSFEFQLSKFYTRDIFKKFQSEVEGMYSCFNTRQVNVNGLIVTYLVKERVEVNGNEKHIKNYEVLYERSQSEVRCICSLFNFNGYLCRHALNVLNYVGVEEILSKYILTRWCKDHKRKLPLDYGVGDVGVNDPLYRYNHLYKLAIQVVEVSAESEEHYKAVVKELEELMKTIILFR